MFIAVLAVALFVVSATTGGSAADSCTASLPPIVIIIGGDGCSASGGGKFVDGIRQSVLDLLQGVTRCKLPGRTPEYPAKSCTELAEQEPDIPSGNYWILNCSKSLVRHNANCKCKVIYFFNAHTVLVISLHVGVVLMSETTTH